MNTEPAVLLFRGRGAISTLIRWQTRGEYSHAALLLPDGQIVEAWQGRGVRVKRLSDWEGIDKFTVLGMRAEQWDKAIKVALAEVGKGYDYWAIIRFISRGRMPENDSWFCSELVFSALAQAGVKLFDRIEPSAVSPGLLAISPMLRLVDGAASVPDRRPVYPACQYCRSDRVVDVQDKIVHLDDRDLPESMRDRAWLYTGRACWDCGERFGGGYTEYHGTIDDQDNL